MAKKLGTGLGELLGEIGASYENALGEQEKFVAKVIEVAVDCIRPNPKQPRKIFNQEALQELSASIQEHGLLQPILVYEDQQDNEDDEESYILIAGERRLRACKMAGFEYIKAIVVDKKPQQLRQIALIENIQREDLNPVEVAQCYKELLEEHNLTHEALAQKISKSRTQITNTLRILTLHDEVLGLIANNKISQGHAKILVGLEEEDQRQVAASIVGQGLSVRETEEIIRTLKNKATKNISTPSKDNVVVYEVYEEELQALMDLFLERGIRVKKNKNQLQLIFEDRESVTKLIQVIQ